MTATDRRRLSLWIALLAVLALVASACGGGGEEVAETGTGTVADAGEAATERVEGQAEATETEVTEVEPTDGAQAAGESCYDGETLTFTVSFSAGGGYDQIARTMGPFLEEELGATVVVENEPGAGGLLALNNMASAEGDELRMGFFTGQGIIGSVLGGAEGANFDPMELSYVGRVAADPRVMVTTGSGPLQTIEDVMAAQGLQYGSAGPGANDYIDAVLMSQVLDLDVEIVTGFEGSGETELALTRGDIDVHSGTVGSRLPAIETGDTSAVLILGTERVEELPDVPALTELDLSEENLTIAESYSELQQMGRMIWAPPGVPENCLDELVTAVGNVMETPEFVKQIEAMGQVVDWAPGPEMRETAQRLLDAPEAFTELLATGYGGQ